MRPFVALALCIGCGSTPAPQPPEDVNRSWAAPLNAVFAVDEAFPLGELEQIAWAVGEWNRALGGLFAWRFQSGGIGDWSIRRVVIDMCDDGPSMGCTRYNQRQIDIDSWGIYPVEAFAGRADMDWTYFRTVLLHELGHAAGLQHTTSGLMARYVGDVACIDQGAVDTLRTAYGVPEQAWGTCL